MKPRYRWLNGRWTRTYPVFVAFTGPYYPMYLR